MTVIGVTLPPLSDDWAKLINWIFTRIGRIVHFPSEDLDASTVLGAADPAFMALTLEGVVDDAGGDGVTKGRGTDYGRVDDEGRVGDGVGRGASGACQGEDFDAG
jgi:pyrroline-5-carboxylate reductase